MTQWLVVTTEPNRERWAEEHLVRQGFEVYLPRFKERVFVNGRAVWRQQILFRRYVFVKMVDIWHAITRTLGVVSVLMSGERPATVPNHIISELKGRDAKGFIRLPALKVGQKVRIIDGPFANRIGLYAGMTSSQREAVLLSAMGCRLQLPIGGVVAA